MFFCQVGVARSLDSGTHCRFSDALHAIALKQAFVNHGFRHHPLQQISNRLPVRLNRGLIEPACVNLGAPDTPRIP
jgi:hypothetical protein